MKKLLVLMLVLGMTSMASAAISLVAPTEINEGETGVIGILNDDGLDYGMYLDIGYISEGGFSMVSVDLTSLAGDMSSIGAPYVYADMWEYEIFLAQSVGTTTPGIQVEATVECLALDVTLVVELYDAMGTLVDSAQIAQVPEPMTVALLGLGGLFLLRRRK
jgi:hypothetical protein